MAASLNKRPAPHSTLTIGFDADDTLWHNETLYRQASDKLMPLLSAHGDPGEIQRVLTETEIRNIEWYGYGFKSYTLSMIEAAIKATAGRIPAKIIDSILQIGRDMLAGEVQLFANARETLDMLAGRHDLILITKGDLLEQSNKVRRSGLAPLFRHVEILQDKTVQSYRDVLQRHHIKTDRFVMVGNSMKSDVLPVLELGGMAVHVPYAHTWAHELADGAGRDYHEIAHLGELADLISKLEEQEVNQRR